MYVSPRKTVGGARSVIAGGRFSDQLDAFGDKVEGRLDAYMKFFANYMAEGFVRATPVKTGQLRGSWRVAFHSNMRATTGRGEEDRAGVKTLARMYSRINSWNTEEQAIYFVNVAPYSWYVERGTSKFAGRYFMASVLSQRNSYATRALNAAKGLYP